MSKTQINYGDFAAFALQEEQAYLATRKTPVLPAQVQSLEREP